MTTKDRINFGVSVAQKKHVPVGSTCAHPSDGMTYELVAYEDDGATAVLSWDGVTKRFKASEVFDPNEAKQAAKATFIITN